MLAIKACHIHKQCVKSSKQLLTDLRNNIQQQLYELLKHFCQQDTAASQRVNFCFRHFIYDLYHLITFLTGCGFGCDCIKVALGVMINVYCARRIMDDKRDQIFRRKYLSNTIMQLPWEWNCKEGQEKLISSGPKHHMVKAFRETWKQSSIDSPLQD